MLSMLRLVRCYQHGATELWQVVTLTAGSKWQSLLMAGDDDGVYDKTTEQHLIVCSHKSVAYVTNNNKTLLGVLYY